jgi:AraC-like DNA-binding protein
MLRAHEVDPGLRVTVAATVIAGTAYHAVTGPAAAALPEALLQAGRVVAAAALVGLWSAVRDLFDPGYTPRQRRVGPAALIGACLVVPALAAAAFPALRPVARGIMGLLAAALVLHLLVLLVLGRRADLDPYRRLLRLLLAGVAALYVGAVLLAWALGWRDARDPVAAVLAVGLQVLVKLGWLALTLGRPSPLQRLWTATHAPEPSPARPLQPAGAPPEPAAQLARRVLDAMETGALYRQPNLGIADLARHLGVPEHRLRAAIHDALGFRNYAAFLNHFRLREVAHRLRDAEDAGRPILTLAMEAGYASIGPFNRAFRDAFGCTPSEYRRSPPLADF